MNENGELLYKKVIELHNQGFGSRRIAKLLNLTDCERKAIERWIYPHKGRVCKPRTLPDLTPSPQLSYVIGVRLGDGTVYHNKKYRNYEVKLKAKDREFVEHFQYCLSKVSRRKVSLYKTKDGFWEAKASSKPLYLFLKTKRVTNYRSIIERFPSEFIRGFADSEGNVSYSNDKYAYVRITMSNTNFRVLEFVQKLLLKNFKIFSSLTIKGVTKGKKTAYDLVISRQLDVATFARFIGFTIKRKMRKLSNVFKNEEKMLKRLELYEQAIMLKRQGLGTRKISKILGVSRSTVQSWLSGRHLPPIVKRMKAK